MNETRSFAGSRVLVVGAAGEAASAVALALAEGGADVALTSLTPDAEEALALRRLARRIEALGRRAVVESLDAGLATGVQVAVRQVAKALGGIDIAIVATDWQLARPAQRTSDAEWARLLSLNLSAAFYACRSVVRELARNQGEVKGRILVLLPLVAPSAAEPAAGYEAARAGTEALVIALAREWAPEVKVNGLRFDVVSSAQAVASLALRAASGDLDGSPDAIAEAP